MRIKAKKVETEEFKPLKWPPIFPLNKGLVAWYTFDDRSGVVLRDRSGKKNTGTLSGCTRIAGKWGSGLSLDGSTDYVTIADSASLDITPSISLVLLFSAGRVNYASKQCLFGKHYSSWELNVRENTTQFQVVFYIDGVESIFSTALYAIVQDKLTHVVLTYTSGSLKFYVNGVLILEKNNYTGALDTNSYNLEFGRRSGGGNPAQMKVYSAMLFNRILSATEVKRFAESKLMLVRH